MFLDVIEAHQHEREQHRHYIAETAGEALRYMREVRAVQHWQDRYEEVAKRAQCSWCAELINMLDLLKCKNHL